MARPDSLLNRVSHRLERDRWLLTKSAWQRLGRLAGRNSAKQTILVAGLQRSGTNMLMDAYERCLDAQVFHENDPRAFHKYRQRDRAVIQALVDRSPARVVVVKALHEGHKVRALLDDFAPAKAIWMYRHFDDTINSNLARWPGGRNRIEKLVADRNSAGWRGLGMTDETHDVVKRHYAPDMSDASALALFFYYRHQLFYDQGFDGDPRVYLLNYEDLVATPGPLVEEVARFSGLAPTRRMFGHIHAQSVRRTQSPDIAPEIRMLAERMFEALQASRLAKHNDAVAA